jgi:hypothetical protein
MSIRNIVLIVLLIFSVLSCHRSQQQNQTSNQRDSEKSYSAFDTLSVLKILALSKEDSLLVHPPDTSSNSVNGDFFDQFRREIISPNMPPFDIRSILSTYNGSKISDYGSYVILYKEVDSTSNLKRIGQDSIEVSIGSLSSFYPEVKIVDVNYDGFKDIVVSFVQNTCGNNGCNDFWIYDSTQQKFIADTALNNMFHDSEIYISEGEKEITSGGRIGAIGYSGEVYRWNGKTYELFAEETTEYSDDGRAIVSMRKEIINGTWNVVRSDTTLNR